MYGLVLIKPNMTQVRIIFNFDIIFRFKLCQIQLKIRLNMLF